MNRLEIQPTLNRRTLLRLIHNYTIEKLANISLMSMLREAQKLPYPNRSEIETLRTLIAKELNLSDATVEQAGFDINELVNQDPILIQELPPYCYACGEQYTFTYEQPYIKCGRCHDTFFPHIGYSKTKEWKT
jgi:NADH pyrophosphatase NudC (nudix superfamily)